MTESIQHIESMIGRYKSFQAGTHHSIALSEIEKYSSVLGKYKELEPRLRELDREEAGHFNMFEIMKVNYYEVLILERIVWKGGLD